MTINRANQTWPEDVMTNLAQKTAQFWQDATPRLVRKLYSAAGLPFTEAVLFSPVEFALLPAALKVAVYESEEFRTGEPSDEFERRQRGSASTIAALFVVALFAVCAIAVFPMLAALANVAK